MTLAKGQFLTQSDAAGTPVDKTNYVQHTYEVIDYNMVGYDVHGNPLYNVTLRVEK